MSTCDAISSLYIYLDRRCNSKDIEVGVHDYGGGRTMGLVVGPAYAASSPKSGRRGELYRDGMHLVMEIAGIGHAVHVSVL